MLKQGLNQKLLQKLSPQQIQFIKLLQVPTAQLKERIEQELEENPALLEADDNEDDDDMGELEMSSEGDAELSSEGDLDTLDSDDSYDDAVPEYDSHDDDERFESTASLDDSFGEDDYDYKQRQSADPNQTDFETPVVARESFYDDLKRQLSMLDLDERIAKIAENIVGNLEDDGYLKRDLFSIADDLAFKFNLSVDIEEVEEALEAVQSLDPPGVGARDLQECLLLQLDRKPYDRVTQVAQRIIMDCFDELTKKHFDKLASKCEATLAEVRDAFELITRLNPKPGNLSSSSDRTQYVIPDFILSIENGEPIIKLDEKNEPKLRISNRYNNMLQTYESKSAQTRSDKETVQFVKTKIEGARWFIDAIKQRQNTLLKTMQCIVNKQREFFTSDGDEAKLKPMILKDVADEIQMDISTVSRVANSKYVQTPFGIYPLKYFFSEGIMTESGDEVSNREVKKILQELIGSEPKGRPLSDQRLCEILEERGYNIARRTVAKYREQLNIPVARLRKGI